jgi:hypothetical protein
MRSYRAIEHGKHETSFALYSGCFDGRNKRPISGGTRGSLPALLNSLKVFSSWKVDAHN